MGLDMFLRAKARPVKEMVKIDKEFDKYNPIYVTFDIGYWRKANSIHGWFDKNYGELNNCQETDDLSIDDLIVLKKLCQKILSIRDKNKLIRTAKKELPPTEGFFFGTYDLDKPEELENYLDDLKETVSIVERCEEFNKKMNGNCWFVYSAWW